MLRRFVQLPRVYSSNYNCSSNRFYSSSLPAHSKAGTIPGELNLSYQPLFTHIIANRRWFSLQDLLHQVKLEGIEINARVYNDLRSCLDKENRTDTLHELDQLMNKENA